MKTPTKNQIVDQIMKDLKKSNLPPLMNDKHLARAKRRLEEWEESKDITRTEKQKEYREEVLYLRKDYLDLLTQDREEYVKTAMALIRLAIAVTIRRIDDFDSFRFVPGIDHQFSIETKKKPFFEEAIEKFGTGIIFSYMCNDGNLRKFIISKLKPWHYTGLRSRKRHNYVTVYFREIDEQSTTSLPSGFPKSEPQ